MKFVKTENLQNMLCHTQKEHAHYLKNMQTLLPTLHPQVAKKSKYSTHLKYFYILGSCTRRVIENQASRQNFRWRVCLMICLCTTNHKSNVSTKLLRLQSQNCIHLCVMNFQTQNKTYHSNIACKHNFTTSCCACVVNTLARNLLGTSGFPLILYFRIIIFFLLKFWFIHLNNVVHL